MAAIAEEQASEDDYNKPLYPYHESHSRKSTPWDSVNDPKSRTEVREYGKNEIYILSTPQ
jgi:hypothetical protein